MLHQKSPVSLFDRAVDDIAFDQSLVDKIGLEGAIAAIDIWPADVAPHGKRTLGRSDLDQILGHISSVELIDHVLCGTVARSVDGCFSPGDQTNGNLGM